MNSADAAFEPERFWVLLESRTVGGAKWRRLSYVSRVLRAKLGDKESFGRSFSGGDKSSASAYAKENVAYVARRFVEVPSGFVVGSFGTSPAHAGLRYIARQRAWLEENVEHKFLYTVKNEAFGVVTAFLANSSVDMRL